MPYRFAHATHRRRLALASLNRTQVVVGHTPLTATGPPISAWASILQPATPGNFPARRKCRWTGAAGAGDARARRMAGDRNRRGPVTLVAYPDEEPEPGRSLADGDVTYRMPGNPTLCNNTRQPASTATPDFFRRILYINGPLCYNTARH